MKLKSPVTITFMFLLMFQGCNPPKNEVVMAVKRQVQQYPESTLQDIYKSFFQDEFGPGHLIGDAEGARQYYSYELSSMISGGNYIAEPCGTGQNFYRVPMDLVKDDKVSSEDYFDAFMESAAAYQIPDTELWLEKWRSIVREIEAMEIQFDNFEQDKAALDQMIQRGETAVHHSKAYSKAYDPHYRIMGKAQWEKLKESS